MLAGITQLSLSTLKSYPSFPEISRVLDNNLNTYYISNKQRNAFWYLQFNMEIYIKWILLSIRGGRFALSIDYTWIFIEMCFYFHYIYQIEFTSFLNKKDRNGYFFCVIDHCELHITAEDRLMSSSTLCKNITFMGLKQHQIAVECDRTMQGDTILVRRTDSGSLRLFEIYPIGTCFFWYAFLYKH